MIRHAETFKDVLMVASYAKGFEHASKHVKVDVAYSAENYWNMIQAGFATLFMAMSGDNLHGALGAIVHPDLHNGDMTAVETFWYVAPEHRGKGLALKRAFERWAVEERGCTRTALIHMEDSYPAELKKLYEHDGYHLIESHYVKEWL